MKVGKLIKYYWELLTKRKSALRHYMYEKNYEAYDLIQKFT